MMRNRTLADIGWAFAIGALLGIGTTLLLREDDDDDDPATAVMNRLRAEGHRARIASRGLSRDLAAAVAAAQRVAHRD